MISDSEFYERFVRQYAAGLREGHRLAAESQEHVDKMLTWAIGLMGAGVFGAYDSLKELSSVHQGLALAPWFLGLLVALGGRLMSRVVVEKDNFHFFKKVHRMEGAVFHYHGEELQKEINAVLTNADELGKEKVAIERLNAWVSRSYYAAHVFLGIGVVVVLVVLLSNPK